MKEYLIVYIECYNNLKYGNKVITAFSKKGAIEGFKVNNNKTIILNVIELE